MSIEGSRAHFNWEPRLKFVNALPFHPRRKIAHTVMEQGRQSPGIIFDGDMHRKIVGDALVQEVVRGAELIAIVGSRARREHTPLRSDVDILVVTNTFTPSIARVVRKGVGGGIHIVRISSAVYDHAQQMLANEKLPIAKEMQFICGYVKEALVVWQKDETKPKARRSKKQRSAIAGNIANKLLQLDTEIVSS